MEFVHRTPNFAFSVHPLHKLCESNHKGSVTHLNNESYLTLV